MELKTIANRELEKKLVSFPPVIQETYQAYYDRMVQAEIRLGQITARDRVLCIGGGPFPATALALARFTGARIDVLEIDEDAAARARHFVEGLRMQGQIRVMQGDGAVWQGADYSVYHVARQVFPKAAVVKNLYPLIGARSRILVRAGYKHMQWIFTALQADKPHLPAYYVYTGPRGDKSSLLLIMRGEETGDEKARFTIDQPDIAGMAALLG